MQDTEIARPEPYGTAIHEAGHAVAGIFFKLGKTKDISIIEGEGYLGRVVYEKSALLFDALDDDDGYKIVSAKQEQYINQFLIATMAGPAAEARFLKLDSLNEGEGADKDLEDLVQLSTLLTNTEEEREAYCNDIFEKAKAFVAVEPNWKRITAIADELVKRKTLSNYMCKKIYRSA